MWRFLLLVLILQKLTLARSAAIPSQDSKKCCPCPSTLRSEPEDPAKLTKLSSKQPLEDSIDPLEDSEDGIPPEEPDEVVPEPSEQSTVRSRPGCTCRLGDMASSGSTPSKSVSRIDKFGSPPPQPKPIFRPEVGLANSLLETLRAANEEELKEARLRASSKPNTLGSARRTATITINNPSSGSQNSFLGTSRNKSPLGKSNSLLESSRQSLGNPNLFPSVARPSLGNTKSVLGSSPRYNPSGRPNTLLRSSLLNPARLSGLQKQLTSQRSGLDTPEAADSNTATSVMSSLQTAPSGIAPALRTPSRFDSVSSAFTQPQLESKNSGILQSRLGSANTPTKRLGSVNSGISRLESPRSRISQTRLGSTNYAISQPLQLGSSNSAISQPVPGSENPGISQPSRLSYNSALPKSRLGSTKAATTQNRLSNSLLRPAITRNPLGSSRIESAFNGNNLGLIPSLPNASRPRLLNRLGLLGNGRLNDPLRLTNQAPSILEAAITKPAVSAVARAGLLGTAPGLRLKTNDMARSGSDIVGQRLPFLGSKVNQLGSSLTYGNTEKLGSNLPNNGLLRDGIDLIDGNPVDPLKIIFRIKQKILDVLVGNPNEIEEDADPMDGESTDISNVVKVQLSENLKPEMKSSDDSVDNIAAKPILKSKLGLKISPLSQNVKGAINPGTLDTSKSINNLANKPLKQEVLSPAIKLDSIMSKSENLASTSPRTLELSPQSSNLSLEKFKMANALEDTGKLSLHLTTQPSKTEIRSSDFIVQPDDIMNKISYEQNSKLQDTLEKSQLPKVSTLKDTLKKLLNQQLSSPLNPKTSKLKVLKSDLMDETTENSRTSNLPIIPKLSNSTEKFEAEEPILPIEQNTRENINKIVEATLKPEKLNSDLIVKPQSLKNYGKEKSASLLPTNNESPLQSVKLQAAKFPSLRDRLQKLLNSVAPKPVAAEASEPEELRSINGRPHETQQATVTPMIPKISSSSQNVLKDILPNVGRVNPAILQPALLDSVNSAISQPVRLSSAISGSSQPRLASTDPRNAFEVPKSISPLIGSSNDESEISGGCGEYKPSSLENRTDTEIEEPNSPFDNGEPIEKNALPETLRAFNDCERCYTKNTEVVAKEQNPTKVYNCKLVCNK